MSLNLKYILKKINNKLKYIEKFIKLVTYPIIGWIFNTQKFEGKLNPNEIKRVLFIRHDFVGDMIVTLPAISYLKTINPNIQIDVFCSKNNYFILNDDPNISNIIIKKDNIIQIIFQLLNLRKFNYDIVFNTQYLYITKNGFYTCLAASKNSIKTMVGSHKKHEIFFNKLSIKAEEQDSIWLKMLYLVDDMIDTSTFVSDNNQPNIDINSFEPYISINEKSKLNADIFFENNNLNDKNIIAINLSARQPQNMWTKESYLAITNLILKNYPSFTILYFSVGIDIEKVEFIKSSIKQDNNQDKSKEFENQLYYYNQTKDIKEVAHALSKADYVITPDTGFIHLASAVKVPIVGLYGSYGTTTQHWRPYKTPFIQIQAGEKDNVSELKPELIFIGFQKLIAHHGNKQYNELINQKDFYGLNSKN